MDCPKCDGELETKTHGEDISVERCTNCYGIFAEIPMLDKMKEEWMIETFLDIGSSSVGRKYDKIDDIECPICKIEMTKIEDEEQSHIWMESCPLCHRVFLDAGEFTDLKYKTVADFVKKLLKGRRKYE